MLAWACIIDVHDGITNFTNGYQNWDVGQVLTFGEYVKVRSLLLLVIRVFHGIGIVMNDIGMRMSLSRHGGSSCMKSIIE